MAAHASHSTPTNAGVPVRSLNPNRVGGARVFVTTGAGGTPVYDHFLTPMDVELVMKHCTEVSDSVKQGDVGAATTALQFLRSLKCDLLQNPHDTRRDELLRMIADAEKLHAAMPVTTALGSSVLRLILEHSRTVALQGPPPPPPPPPEDNAWTSFCAKYAAENGV